MRFSRLLFPLLALVVFTVGALAQSGTSSLHGTIADPKGGVIPNAKVTLTNPSVNYSRETTTDGQGEYQFQQVPPGTYTVTVEAAGMSKSTSKNVPLLVSQPATLDLTMKVGAETTVEVNAAAVTLNTSDATIGNAFDEQKMQALPLEARNVVELLSLQPGVAYTGPSGVAGNTIDPNFDSRNGSVNGSRSDQSNVVLDGIDNNDQNNGYAFAGALRSPLDSVQEFRVTTTNSNAETGRSSGGQVQLITKAGTNKFHGSLYESNRSSIGEANDWFIKHSQLANGQANKPTKLVRNVYGASLGGPLVKDRLFFFGTFEAFRSRETVNVTRTVPSMNLRQGIISYSCTSDPACPASGTQTLTPADLVTMDQVQGIGASAAVMALMQGYPLPNSNSVGDGLNFEGFTFGSPQPTDENTYIAKLDYNLSKNGNHKIFLRGNLQDDIVADVEQFPGQGPSRTTSTPSKGLGAGYTALLSNNLINNFRYGFTRQSFNTVGQGTQHHVRLRGLSDPQSFARDQYVAVPVQNFVDDLSWTKGKHTVQFGVNYRIVNDIRANTLNSFNFAITNASWLDNAKIANTSCAPNPCSFNPSDFGFPAVDASFQNSYDYPLMALVGIVDEATSQYNFTTKGGVLPEGAAVSRHFKGNEFEWYAQDAWRIKPNLTVNFGLRWAFLQPPYEVNGEQVAPTKSIHDWYIQRGVAMNQGQSFADPITFDVAGKANGKPGYWSMDWTDIAPRFSFAYSPGFWKSLFGENKTSIRGGFGMYHDHFGEGIVNTFDANGSFGLSTNLDNSPGVQSVDTSPRFTDQFTIPAALITPAPPASFPVTYPNIFAITWGLDDKLKTPYSYAFDFSVEHELPGGFIAEGAYVGRLSRRLLQQNDLAMPLDLRDPKSGMDYFTAASMLSQYIAAGTPESAIPNIPFWENFYGSTAAGAGGVAGCAAGAPGSPTATQNIYDLYSCFPSNETTSLFILDGAYGGPCFPGCAQLAGGPLGGNPFEYFSPQFSSLYSWQSIGNSAYHAGQLMLRHPMKHGVQFDFNYTYSKSIDQGSDTERIDFVGGPGDQIINAWDPRQGRAVSTFDTTHQINSNFVVELPFGRGRHFAANASRVANAFAGGWNVSGLFRWTSGFPVTIYNGAQWPTNWELGGNAVLTSQVGTGVYTDACGEPNIFQFPVGTTCSGGALQNTDPFISSFAGGHWRPGRPGEAGPRNNLRGPGYMGVDAQLSKTFKITEGQELRFAWDTFNVFNNVRFNLLPNQPSIDTSGTFGRFNDTFTKSRRMQFTLRYTF